MVMIGFDPSPIHSTENFGHGDSFPVTIGQATHRALRPCAGMEDLQDVGKATWLPKAPHALMTMFLYIYIYIYIYIIMYICIYNIIDIVQLCPFHQETFFGVLHLKRDGIHGIRIEDFPWPPWPKGLQHLSNFGQSQRPLIQKIEEFVQGAASLTKSPVGPLQTGQLGMSHHRFVTGGAPVQVGQVANSSNASLR